MLSSLLHLRRSYQPYQSAGIYQSLKAYTHHHYDVIVIGGGHAGCEAANASARTGSKTLLLTQKKQTIGQLSCSPSIGGVGKSQIVKQIDALGGLMGKVADISCISKRVLNKTKGEAVQGYRMHVDRDAYKIQMQKQLAQTSNLTVAEVSVEDFEVDDKNKVIKSLKSDRGQTYFAKNYVLTTGTFLRGMVHIGDVKYPAGRHLRDGFAVEKPTIALANTLKRLDFPISRCTTGTPPRLDHATIDYTTFMKESQLEENIFFHFQHEWRGYKHTLPQVSTYRGSTNQNTHQLVLQYSNKLPVFDQNEGKGVGPRYCPSLQKKVRVSNLKQHYIFFEKESSDTNIVYPSGLSMAFPQQLQLEILRSMKGLEHVKMLRPGYAIQYDFLDPKAMLHTLKSQRLNNLFLAGQINGTTGYEEAGGQGIVAGINAGLSAKGHELLKLERENSFIGVMIDDLISQGVSEPYRMLTTRSQNRMKNRNENSDIRLTPIGIDLGIISEKQKAIFQEKTDRIEHAQFVLHSTIFSGSEILQILPLFLIQKKEKMSLWGLLCRFEYMRIRDFHLVSPIDVRLHQFFEIEAKYSSKALKDEKTRERIKKVEEHTKIQSVQNLNFEDVRYSIAKQDFEKLQKLKPKTLADARRVGLKPTTIQFLYNRAREFYF